jgi:hypothetical protein
VGLNSSAISHCHATATVSGDGDIGGLVGDNNGQKSSVTYSSATGAVSNGFVTGGAEYTGGLVGYNEGTVGYSFATGIVTAGYNTRVGGLVGYSDGTIDNSYATGALPQSPESDSYMGGMVGYNDTKGTTATSYSTGSVAPNPNGGYSGGFVGFDHSKGGVVDSSWDTDTSGISNLSQGAGNIANDPGITGLTTVQFQSGLPAGFDPSIWGENAGINGGLPYLLANPPPS